MEVKGAPSRHPDQSRVKSLVVELLESSRKRVAEWSVEMMEYDFYSGVYAARLTLNGNTAIAKIPSEWIDEVWKDDSKFKRRKIKRVLKEAVEKFYELEDDND